MAQEKEIQRLLISVGEAAKLIGLGRTKMYEVVKRNQFPVVRIDGRIFINPVTFAEWIKSQEQ